MGGKFCAWEERLTYGLMVLYGRRKFSVFGLGECGGVGRNGLKQEEGRGMDYGSWDCGSGRWKEDREEGD